MPPPVWGAVVLCLPMLPLPSICGALFSNSRSVQIIRHDTIMLGGAHPSVCSPCTVALRIFNTCAARHAYPKQVQFHLWFKLVVSKHFEICMSTCWRARARGVDHMESCAEKCGSTLCQWVYHPVNHNVARVIAERFATQSLACVKQLWLRRILMQPSLDALKA